jgi:hypothetical protein
MSDGSRRTDEEDSEAEQWDTLRPRTPIQYRLAARGIAHFKSFLKWFVSLLFIKIAGIVSLVVSLGLLAVWLGSHLAASGETLPPFAAFSLGWRHLGAFFDSMSALESQFAVLFGVFMFCGGIMTWYVYTKLVGIVPRCWRTLRALV